MGNHFHLLVLIKENVFYKYNKPNGSVDDYQCIKPDRSGDAVRFEINDFEMRKWETIYIPNLSSSEGHDRLTNTKNIKIPKPYLHFSHLFNAYSKYFNKKYRRHGSLFERPFKRKLVDDFEYLRQLVLYIHNNPVHHGFCSHPVEYLWTSYLSMISLKPTKLLQDVVIGWFDGEANFKHMHNGKVETEEIEKWLRIG